MYFLENSKLRITVSNFLKNHSMYDVLSHTFFVVFLVLLVYNFQLCKILQEFVFLIKFRNVQIRRFNLLWWS